MYTAIEVVGLSIALAFVVFIAVFVAGELGYDKELKGTENIYVGHEEEFAIMSYTVGDILKESYPQIEDVCSFLATNCLSGLQMEVMVGDETLPQNAIMARSNFFDFFTFPFIEGERKGALQEQNAVVISESFANRHFPETSPVGRTLAINVAGNRADLIINGVYKDIERSVFPQVDIIYNVEQLKTLYPSLLRSGNGTATHFYKLAPGTDLKELGDNAAEKLKKTDILYECGLFKKYFFSPFSQIHYGVCSMHYPFVGRIDKDFVMLFAAAGILLLVFALLNYISLTVAQIGFRAKEMATRRLLGEQKWEISSRYIKEAFLLTAVSFILAIGLIELLGPHAKILLGKEISLKENVSVGMLACGAAAMLAVSFLAGAIPAILISRYRPVDVVKGEFATSSKMVLGKIFIGIQNVVAISVLCVAFAMFVQFKYMLERDNGYTKENVIGISGGMKNADYLPDELLQFPFVEKVGHIQFLPSEGGRVGMGMDYKGEVVQLDVMYGDSSAFDIMGFRVLNILENVKPVNGTMWLTEGAFKTFGIEYSDESIILTNESYGICGVIQNFQRGNRTVEDCASSNIVWMNREFKDDSDFEVLRSLVVKVSGDEDYALRQLRDFYLSQGFGEQVEVHSQNEIYRTYFKTEENNLKLITTFTFLVMMLSAMAMLAMSTYYARQQSRNWSVRKVFGCSRGEIYRSILASFLKVVLVAAIISVPVGYYIVGEWLAGYSYRIGNYWWLYALALLLICVVAVVSISWQAVRLMNSNPVEELKKE